MNRRESGAHVAQLPRNLDSMPTGRARGPSKAPTNAGHPTEQLHGHFLFLMADLAPVNRWSALCRVYPQREEDV